MSAEPPKYGNYYPERVIRAACILLARQLGIAESGVVGIANSDPKGEKTELGWLVAKLKFILDPDATDPQQWPWISDEKVALALLVAHHTITCLAPVVRQHVPEEVFERIIGDDGGDLSALLQPA